MAHEDIDVLLENQNLKSEFAWRNLDLTQVWQPSPDDLELENRRLRYLLDWVEKYEECGSRQAMEAEGYDFPPIYPDIDPDSDWFRFRRWLMGKPIRKTAKSRLPRGLVLKSPDDLTDDEIVVILEKLTAGLGQIHLSVDLNEGVPPRLIYEHLLEVIEEEFELLGGGTWHLDGCTGYCPGCFQRPWCEFGANSCWSEDEEVGCMVFPDNVKRYVSPSPVSLTILRQAQAEEDRKMKKIMDEMEREKNDKTEKIKKAARKDETDVDDGLPF